MPSFPIRREDADSRGRYVVIVDGHESEMTFNRATRNGQALMIVNHTGVPAALSGRGVGLALVQHAVDDARREGFHIVPVCSFVRTMFQRHKDWQDVLATPETAR